MKLPRIKLSLNSTLNNEFFLTDTDDIGFARKQINQIDYRIRTKLFQKLKPWERFIDNNIYSSLDKNNRLTIKEKKKKIKNNSLSFNWNNQNYFNKTEMDNIMRFEDLKKQVKIKYDTKYKFKEPNITVSNFIATRNDTFLTNKMIKILKEEKENIRKKQEDYEKSLKYENKTLDKDIDKFNDFSIKLKKKMEENEYLLLKVITDNKNLVELYKKQLQEYNSTTYEVFKYIKLINKFKHYASFIHKILGGDNDILHCDIIENINYNDFKNRDVFAITQNIIKKTKNILNDKNISDDDSEVLNLDDSIALNNFNSSFKSLEENIVKIFMEKQRYINEREDIARKGKLDEEEKKMKFENLYEDYDAQIEELDEKKKDFNQIYLTPEEREFIEFNYELLKDVYSLLFGNIKKNKEIKDFKAENATDMYREVVCPIIKEIYNKEDKVNKLINIMEEYENENKAIFNKVLTNRKMENRALKLFQEKELIKMKEIKRIRKYNNKMKKIIIKGRYKYNSPTIPENAKSVLKRVNKTEMEINDFNMLKYK